MLRRDHLSIVFTFVLLLYTGYPQRLLAQESLPSTSLGGIDLNQGLISSSSLANSPRAFGPRKGHIKIGVLTDYSQNPATIQGSDQHFEIVESSIRTTALISYGLSKRISFDLSLPWVIQSEIERYQNQETVYGTYGNEVADMTGQVKLALFLSRPFSASLSVFAKVPTGDSLTLSGDDQVSSGALATVSGGFASLLWTASGGYHYRESDAVLRDERALYVLIGSQYVGSIGAAIKLSRNFMFESSLLYRTSESDLFEYEMAEYMESTHSLKAAIGNGFQIKAGAALGLSEGFGVSDYKLLTGFTWSSNQYSKIRQNRRIHRKMVEKRKSRVLPWYMEQGDDFRPDEDVRRKKRKKTKQNNKKGRNGNRSFGFGSESF